MSNEEKFAQVESQIIDLLRQNEFTLEEFKTLIMNLKYKISKSLTQLSHPYSGDKALQIL